MAGQSGWSHIRVRAPRSALPGLAVTESTLPNRHPHYRIARGSIRSLDKCSYLPIGGDTPSKTKKTALAKRYEIRYTVVGRVCVCSFPAVDFGGHTRFSLASSLPSLPDARRQHRFKLLARSRTTSNPPVGERRAPLSAGSGEWKSR